MKKLKKAPTCVYQETEMKVNMELIFFQGKVCNKNSADIMGKKKLLMLIKSDFYFSHVNFGSYSPSKHEHSLHTSNS